VRRFILVVALALAAGVAGAQATPQEHAPAQPARSFDPAGVLKPGEPAWPDMHPEAPGPKKTKGDGGSSLIERALAEPMRDLRPEPEPAATS